MALASAFTWQRSSDSGRKIPRRSTRSTSEGVATCVSAATEAGVERIVYTSTVATLGLWDTKAGRPSNEDDVADLSHLYGNYKQTKYVAEHEVLRLAAQGAPVVLVLPTMPHGPFDHRPTPSGKVVLDYLNGRIPGFVDTAMNVAHVDDLADGPPARAGERPPRAQLHLRGREHHDVATLGASLERHGAPGGPTTLSRDLSPAGRARVTVPRRHAPSPRTPCPLRGSPDGLDHDDL